MSVEALRAEEQAIPVLAELARMSVMVESGPVAPEDPFMPDLSDEEDADAGVGPDTRAHESFCGLRFGRACDCAGLPCDDVAITNAGAGFGMIIGSDCCVTKLNGEASAAKAAGVAMGSVILAVNGTVVTDKDAILAQLKAVPAGQPVSFKLLRPNPGAARPRQASAAPEMPDSSDDEAEAVPGPLRISYHLATFLSRFHPKQVHFDGFWLKRAAIQCEIGSGAGAGAGAGARTAAGARSAGSGASFQGHIQSNEAGASIPPQARAGQRSSGQTVHTLPLAARRALAGPQRYRSRYARRVARHPAEEDERPEVHRRSLPGAGGGWHWGAGCDV